MNQQVPPFMQQPSNPKNPFDPYQQRPFNQAHDTYAAQQMDTNPPPPPLQRLNITDHIKSSSDNPMPIFIFPHQQCVQANPPVTTNHPYPAPIYYGPPCPSIHTTYLPYPMPIPMYNFTQPGGTAVNQAFPLTQDCHQTSYTSHRNQNRFSPSNHQEHKCCQGDDVAICAARDCPAGISLQALASQFLSIQGILSCAATRILLKRIPGSNIIDSDEMIVNRAEMALDGLTKDQLLAESRSCHKLNAMINLHMTMKPPVAVLPVLTLVQLKINLLKTRVESNINKKIMENQGLGAETGQPLDEQSLSFKTEAELREMMSCLKQKEANERVNLTLACHHLQRSIVENHLHNIKRKIVQLEEEFDRRRCCDRQSNRGSSKFSQHHLDQSSNSIINDFQFESCKPLLVEIRNPKKLRLQPHVGCPETTYDRPKGQRLVNNCGEKEKKSETGTNDDSNLIMKLLVLVDGNGNKGSSVETDIDDAKKVDGQSTDNSTSEYEVEDEVKVENEEEAIAEQKVDES